MYLEIPLVLLAYFPIALTKLVWRRVTKTSVVAGFILRFE